MNSFYLSYEEMPYYRLFPGEVIYRDLDEGPVNFRLANDTSLRIVDPGRDLSDDEIHGTRASLNAAIGAFIVSPDEIDLESGVGYKALRESEQVEIGRSSSGRFKIGEYVSRHHVRISLEGRVVSITDLNSTNGTFIMRATPRSGADERSLAGTINEPSPEVKRPNIITAGGGSAASERHPDRNEDSWFVDTKNRSFGVFDGVGGAAGSALAAQIAAQIVERILSRTPSDLPLSLTSMQMSEALRRAHRAIMDHGNGSIQTTATIAKLFADEQGGQHVAVASAGDSRAYILRDGELRAITLDHGVNISSSDSERQAMQETFANVVDLAKLSHREQALFRQRNIISSSLGDSNTFLIAGTTELVMSGDKLLLTTDGIHDNLTTDEIKHWINRQAKDDVLVERLIEAAQWRSREVGHIRAKKDDMTAVLVTIH